MIAEASKSTSPRGTDSLRADSSRAGRNSQDPFSNNADRYHDELERGIRLSGESAEYFARQRILATSRYATHYLDRPVSSVLDFGCGIGTATRYLSAAFPTANLIGCDPAFEAIEHAIQSHDPAVATFRVGMEGIETESIDLAYCNGVFHHIEPSERNECLTRIADAMRPGGLFCLWENNPWNPGTQLVMRRIPFDRDANCLNVFETKRRLQTAGFTYKFHRAYFYFPGFLSALRPAERWLRRLPLGAQYVAVAQKV